MPARLSRARCPPYGSCAACRRSKADAGRAVSPESAPAYPSRHREAPRKLHPLKGAPPQAPRPPCFASGPRIELATTPLPLPDAAELAPSPSSLYKSAVIAHCEPRFDLRHRVERDADDDQERRRAEVEGRYAEAALHRRRQNRQEAEVDGRDGRDPQENLVDVVDGRLTRPNAGDERSVLL